MFREETTGRHRHAIRVALRLYEGGYGPELPMLVVESATAHLIVRADNQSDSAEVLELTVEGMPVGWAEVYPREVHVPAGEHREADVSVSIPRAGDLKAAEWPLRVVAYARERRVGSAAARVCVAPHAVVALELHPREVRARHRGYTEIRVRNEGDAATDVDLTASGPPVPVGCVISPGRVHVGPGEEVVARLEIRAPRRWLKRGEPVPIAVSTHGASAEGTFQQRPAVPKWAFLVPVLAAALGGWHAARPNEISVPSVTGLTVPEARNRLREAGLTARAAPLPAQAAQVAQMSGVVRQDPPAGAEVADGGDVTISYYKGEGVGTVTPKLDATSQVAPAAGEQEPIAFVQANRVVVQFPGEAEANVGGTVGELSSEPAWDPSTGQLAYVRRASPTSAAEIVSVDPHAPGTPRALTQGSGSYVNPAFAPDGSRLAVISEDGSGYGGSLCVVVPPALAPRCQHDPDWRYANPTFAPDGALYVLRRSTSSTRKGGWDELVRVNTNLVQEGEPIVSGGDLRAVAVGRDGRFGLLARRPGDTGYHADVLNPAGAITATQSGDPLACDVVWSGAELLISAGTCGAVEEILQLDPANLDAGWTKLRDGGDPAVIG